jgi:hypothetical protein
MKAEEFSVLARLLDRQNNQFCDNYGLLLQTFCYAGVDWVVVSSNQNFFAGFQAVLPEDKIKLKNREMLLSEGNKKKQKCWNISSFPTILNFNLKNYLSGQTDLKILL